MHHAKALFSLCVYASASYCKFGNRSLYHMQDIKPEYGASVIICCFNSYARLPDTLQHLAQQTIPDEFTIEILVVNNASTDDTVAIAKQELDKISSKNISYKIINEEKPGQMHARKKRSCWGCF